MRQAFINDSIKNFGNVRKMIDIDKTREQVDKWLVERQLAERQEKKDRQAVEVSQQKVDDLLQAQEMVQHIAQAVQQKAHAKIARIVTKCLGVVFDDPYEFHIRFDRKRGKTEARMVFVRDGLELDDPLNEVGGGVIDVAALALRLACIMLSKPVRRKLVVLDEPFSQIRGKQNQARTREMLIQLADELGIQFVLCTDIPAYRLGTIIEI